MILVKIENYKTLGVCPPSLQTTYNALSVVDVIISLTNALIMSAKDVIEETLVITRNSASSNHDDPNHDLLWQNNKLNEPELTIQISSKTNHFLLLSLVSLQPEDDSWNIFSPRPQRINVVTLRDLDAYYDVRVTTRIYIKSQPHLVSRLHHPFFLSYSI